MPPKPKNTREEIAAAALAIIKEEGLGALTARALGKRLDASAGSIFTVLKSMEEVRLAARELAMEEFRAYISDYREYRPPFKRIGTMVVAYGLHEPELFKLLFMTEHSRPHSFTDTMADLGDMYPVCLELIERDYLLSPTQAEYMFEHMWIQAFGLGAMCAMRVCTLSMEEIGKRLGLSFMSLYMFLRSGREDGIDIRVERTDGTESQGYGADTLNKTLFEQKEQRAKPEE